MEEIRERKVILFIHLLLSERSKFMYWVRQQYYKTDRHSFPQISRSHLGCGYWKGKRDHIMEEYYKILSYWGEWGWVLDANFLGEESSTLEISPKWNWNVFRYNGPVYTTLHIYLYSKSNIFTVHKDSFSKAVAMATNQGNHSNNPVLCTALIAD